MLCSENTSEIDFQVVPHSIHGISHPLRFQHWKICFKTHSSPIPREKFNFALCSSESAKLFPQSSFLDGQTRVFYFLPTQ